MDGPRRPHGWSGRLCRMRPILRPGTHVLRRTSGDVQIGLDPATALVLPDREPVRSTLRLLAASATRREYADPSLLEHLERHGLVVDERDLLPLLADERISPHTAAALVRSTGSAAPELRAARRARRGHIRVFGHPPAGHPHDELRGPIHAAGGGAPTRGWASPPRGGL